jgi:hypothetical protein
VLEEAKLEKADLTEVGEHLQEEVDEVEAILGL